MKKISINRAPVLTLWAAVIARRLGYDEDSALTLGQALAALNAQSKGRRLGIYAAKDEAEGEDRKKKTAPAGDSVPLLGREIPVIKSGSGVRAAPGGEVVKPEAVRAYLTKKFGEDLDDARSAMEALARSMPPGELGERGFDLYEKFRPKIPEGKKGWGAKGQLDLDVILRLAK